MERRHLWQQRDDRNSQRCSDSCAFCHNRFLDVLFQSESGEAFGNDSEHVSKKMKLFLQNAKREAAEGRKATVPLPVSLHPVVWLPAPLTTKKSSLKLLREVKQRDCLCVNKSPSIIRHLLFRVDATPGCCQ